MTTRHVTPPQLRAVEAASRGQVTKIAGVSGWLLPSGCTIRQDVLDRVYREGLIVKKVRGRSVGGVVFEEYGPSAAGRALLDIARAERGA